VVGEEEGGESNCGGKKRRRGEVRGCFGCLWYLQGFKAALYIGDTPEEQRSLAHRHRRHFSKIACRPHGCFVVAVDS
jgi:hypothetical protein